MHHEDMDLLNVQCHTNDPGPVVALMEYYVCYNRRPAYPIPRDERPERVGSTRSEVPAAPALSVPWFFMAIDGGTPSHGSRSEPMGPHCLPAWTSVKLAPSASGRGGAMLARIPSRPWMARRRLKSGGEARFGVGRHCRGSENVLPFTGPD
ncbi:hypothetical protein C8Q79DRAFT_283890 [Trametes meyenii]|nr:hypothetical protein C8Q79DRAFT_283890 [Trametes meyenii]